MTAFGKAKMSEGRKCSKPIMEKRRRARINKSLNELKTLVLRATNKDASRYSKLEKADILEMTVNYLKKSPSIHSSKSAKETSLSRFLRGFTECAGEVTRYVTSLDGIEFQLKTQILSHLATCCQNTSAALAAISQDNNDEKSNTTTILQPGSQSVLQNINLTNAVNFTSAQITQTSKLAINSVPGSMQSSSFSIPTQTSQLPSPIYTFNNENGVTTRTLNVNPELIKVNKQSENFLTPATAKDSALVNPPAGFLTLLPLRYSQALLVPTSGLFTPTVQDPSILCTTEDNQQGTNRHVSSFPCTGLTPVVPSNISLAQQYTYSAFKPFPACRDAQVSSKIGVTAWRPWEAK